MGAVSAGLAEAVRTAAVAAEGRAADLGQEVWVAEEVAAARAA